MGAKLRQVLVGFSPEEDRLLLRFATTERTEIRLHLTRRFVRLFWDAAVKALESHPEVKAQAAPEARKALMSFQHEEAVRSGKFIKKLEDEERTLPLGEEPLLVTGARCSPMGDGHTRIAFGTREGKTVTANFDRNLLHTFCHLLIGATEKAGWDLGLSLGEEAAPAEPTAPSRVH